MMVSALRVGQSLISALDLVAKESPDPVSTEFRICCEEQNYGLELRTALNNLVNPGPDSGSEYDDDGDSDPEGNRRKPCRGA